MTYNEHGNMSLMLCGIFLLIGVLFWIMYFGAPVYPEDRVITVDSVEYHTSYSYTEIRIKDTNGAEYEFSMQKHMFDNPMYAKSNTWNFSHEQTIEPRGKYRITLWHSIFMGNYVTDPFSNWNPNPEISKIVRLD